jgi:hypothetical protein
MGLRRSHEKTLITHIDEGLDFLGWRIQRHRKRGSDRQYVYTYPSRKAVKAATGKVKTICRTTDTNLPLDALLLRLNPALQGWCAYFRPGVSADAFSYLSYYAWQQAGRWLRRKHHRSAWKDLRHLYYKGDARWPASEDRQLFNPAKAGTTRYRYRGTTIPTLAVHRMRNHAPSRTCGAPGAGDRHAGCGKRLWETGRSMRPEPRPGRLHRRLRRHPPASMCSSRSRLVAKVRLFWNDRQPRRPMDRPAGAEFADGPRRPPDRFRFLIRDRAGQFTAVPSTRYSVAPGSRW